MIGQFLKKFRNANYSGKNDMPPNPDADPNAESDENEPKSRSLALTDDEMQSFQGLEAGSEVDCQVHGTLGSDGTLNVLTVQPTGKDQGMDSEQEMAGQVAQKVTPSVQLSPS